MGQLAGPESEYGRIKSPPDYRDVLRAKEVTLPLSDTSTPAYELFHVSGVIYCRKGIDNILKLANIVKEHAKDTQTGDLEGILDLYTLRSSLESSNRPVFTKRKLTSVDDHPEKWISLRQMLEAIGVDVEQLITKPTLVETMSDLAATAGAETCLNELATPKLSLAPRGPYGFGTRGRS